MRQKGREGSSFLKADSEKVSVEVRMPKNFSCVVEKKFLSTTNVFRCIRKFRDCFKLYVSPGYKSHCSYTMLTF